MLDMLISFALRGAAAGLDQTPLQSHFVGSLPAFFSLP
jgi:hypothetical protein